MPTATMKPEATRPGRTVGDLDAAHNLEREVHRRLQAEPGIDIKSLVVRRIPAGVCLEGRIETQDRDVDLRRLMAGIPGLNEIVNHLVVCCPWPRADEEAA
jgi:hypothetical protein